MPDNDNATAPAPVETIPSVQHGITAMASANAPFVYFEEAPTFAYFDGVIRVTLTAEGIFQLIRRWWEGTWLSWRIRG